MSLVFGCEDLQRRLAEQAELSNDQTEHLAACSECAFVWNLSRGSTGERSAFAIPVVLAGLEIREYLGGGAFGNVYRAWQPSLQRMVAVKLIPIAAGVTAGELERVQREGVAIAQLRHPGVLHVLDSGIVEGPGPSGNAFYFLISELAEGSLRERLDEFDPRNATGCLRFIERVLRALQSAHTSGIVHCDIKPENILLQEVDGELIPKLADFGLALAFKESGRTGHAGIVGTPAYLAPELLQGEPHSVRSDLFALGIVFFELLARRGPRDVPDLETMRRCLAEGTSLRSVAPWMSESIAEVIASLLEREPARRPASALAVAERLARILESRRRLIIRAGATAIVTLVLVVIGFLVRLSHERGAAVRDRQVAQNLRWTATWKLLAFEATRQRAETGDDDLAGLLARQAFLIHGRLVTQPTGLLQQSLYSVFPVGEVSHVLHGHDAAVLAVAFSPGGQTLASGGWDRTVRAWNLQSPERSAVILARETSGVWTLAFSPDGHWLAMGCDDSTIEIRDRRSAASKPTVLRGHRGEVHAVRFTKQANRLVSGGNDKTIRFWDMSSALEPFDTIVADHGIWALALSPDGTRLASGADDGTIEIRELVAPHAPPLILHGHRAGVWALEFSPDGQTLASGSDDHSVLLWDLSRKTPTAREIGRHGGHVFAVAFAPDGKTLASCAADSTIRIWNVARADAEPQVLRAGQHGDIRSVAFSPDGRLLVSGSEDTTIHVWELNKARPAAIDLPRHEGVASAVAFAHDGSRLASASGDRLVRVWNVDGLHAEPPIQLEGSTGALWSVALDAKGERIAAGGASADLFVWEPRNGPKPAHVFAGHHGTVWSVAFSPDGGRLASASADRTVRVWYVSQQNRPPLVLERQRGDEILRSTAREDRPCFLPTDAPQTQGDAYALAFSPDGKRLASGNADHNVRIWNLDHPTAPPLKLVGHQDFVCAVAFSPDGRTLASGSGDNTIRIWDLAHPDSFARLAGHSDDVLSVAFSPDGFRLASGSADKTVRIWDLTQPQSNPVLLPRQNGRVLSVAFSADGEQLAIGGEDNKVRLWGQARTLADLECQLVWRNLSLKEWHLFVGDETPYQRTCGNLPAGDGAPLDSPAAGPANQ